MLKASATASVLGGWPCLCPSLHRRRPTLQGRLTLPSSRKLGSARRRRRRRDTSSQPRKEKAVNSINITGRLARDPDPGQLPDGTPICTVRLVVRWRGPRRSPGARLHHCRLVRSRRRRRQPGPEPRLARGRQRTTGNTRAGSRTGNAGTTTRSSAASRSWSRPRSPAA